MEFYVKRIQDGVYWFERPDRAPGPHGVTGVRLEVEGPLDNLNKLQLQTLLEMLGLPVDEPVLFLIEAFLGVVRA